MNSDKQVEQDTPIEADSSDQAPVTLAEQVVTLVLMLPFGLAMVWIVFSLFTRPIA